FDGRGEIANAMPPGRLTAVTPAGKITRAMPLTLVWKSSTTLTVDAEALRPDALRGLSGLEVARLRVPVGNGSREVGELFRVDGDCGDSRLVAEGDLTRLRRLGAGM